ncbi:FecR domain-containing protein [Belliella sp. DSM 107340]|uniref:FecR domain-containing protein n=1 Tax=Belliella calami TaxID=2923436 RepID=A0ABS9UJM6_9BACT|nr:FecR family protein [Belliella calami]MCH7396831.1 FecR domain-containing protein [Belliella calami]
MDKNIFRKTLLRLFKGKASDEDKNLINDWYHAFDSDEDIIIEDHKNRNRQEIRNEIFSNIQTRSGLKNQERSRRMYFLTFAIAACICIGLFNLAYKFSNPSFLIQPEESFISFQNEVGMIKKVKLPDGSYAQLHHNSSIEVNKDFSQKRKVLLKGKAFFDVVPNKDLPFTIETKSFKTTVLGTSFSIESRPGSFDKVAVKSGNVSVQSQEFGEVLLGKDETVKLENNQFVQGSITNSELEFGWTKRTLVFENTDLSTMILEIENWYGVTLSSNCENLPNRKISGAYHDMNLEELLITIQFSIPLEFEINKQSVHLTFKECK